MSILQQIMQIDDQQLRNLDQISTYNDYKVKQIIGVGAEGQVSLIEDENGKQLALKINNVHIPQDKVKLLLELNHKNVIRIYDIKTENIVQYCTMKYANQGDLNQFLIMRQRLQQPLSYSEIQSIFSQICRGVMYLHSKKIVHGDITPSNILFCNNQVKIADFMQSNKSQLVYSAPELLIQQEGPSKYSDVWSLGIILYQMLKGRLPYLTTTEITLRKKIPVMDVPFCFKKIINCCLIYQPINRIRLINIMRTLEKGNMIVESESFISSAVNTADTNINFE
ncbi:Kinase [Hexamita inflata]|uniref:CAMK CAMKL n=1 Tax=Hexamita inflata TaxID=28002 RepID=A0AA86NMG5_9EUKA|nr:CAMK CAMKL [Hexamita inflata]